MKKTGRIIGVLFLIQFSIGVLLNQFLIGPITFSPDYLTIVSDNSTQLIIGGLISLLSGILCVWIAIQLFPFFKQSNNGLAMLYFGFSIINFAVILIDTLGVLSLLSVSQEFVQSGSTETDYFKTVGNIFFAIRAWTHYLVLIIAAFNLFAFYSALYSSKLLPRYISIWGLFAVVVMITALILAIFDTISFDTEMILFIPLAINQLFMIIWLMTKGLSTTVISNSTEVKLSI